MSTKYKLRITGECKQNLKLCKRRGVYSKCLGGRHGYESVVANGLVVYGLVCCHGRNYTIFGHYASRPNSCLPHIDHKWAICATTTSSRQRP